MVARSLVELLIALALTLVVFGAAAGVAVQSTDGFLAVPEHADVLQRLRVAVERMRLDLAEATVGAGGDRDRLAPQSWPAVVPCGRDRDPVTGVAGPCARDDTFSLLLEARPLRARVRDPVTSTTSAIRVDVPSGCVAGVGGCRLVAGEPLVVADGYGRADLGRVAAAAVPAEFLAQEPPRSGPVAAGSVVRFVSPRTYYVRRDPAAAALQLRRRDGDSDLPLVDNLARWRIEYVGRTAPPVVAFDAEGRAVPNYGPAPVRLDGPPGSPPAYQASCAYVLDGGVPVSRLEVLPGAGGNEALLPLDRLRDGPWCPDDASPWRVDLDTFRITRLRLSLAVQAASPAHRGTDTAWFVQPGQALRAARLVPDVSAVVDLVVAGGR